jgi:transcription elongation factor GreB
MSRGFIKEDDQEEIPMVPPRADLPEGVPNYVTPAGMEELLAEKQMLVDEKDSLDSSNENERRVALNHINAKLRLLENRIASARVVEPGDQAPGEIRFGATVKLRNVVLDKVQTFQIVGVDEADFSRGKIAFTSPVARALINKKAGERAILKRGREELVFEVLEISYT